MFRLQGGQRTRRRRGGRNGGGQPGGGHRPVCAARATCRSAPTRPQRRSLRDLAEAGGGQSRRAVAQEATLIIHELASCCAPDLPLDQALDVLINLRRESLASKKLMGRVLERVRGGSSLADAMAVHGRGLRSLLSSAWSAPARPVARSTSSWRRPPSSWTSHQTRQNLKSALIYPVILFISRLHLRRHHRHRRHSELSRRSSIRRAMPCRWRRGSSWGSAIARRRISGGCRWWRDARRSPGLSAG